MCYLEVFGYGGYEALGEIAGQAVEGGILLLEEAFYVGGDFIFVAYRCLGNPRPKGGILANGKRHLSISS